MSQKDVEFLVSIDTRIDRNPMARTMGALDDVMDAMSSVPAGNDIQMLQGQAQGLAQAIRFMSCASVADVTKAAQERWRHRQAAGPWTDGSGTG